MVDSFASSCSLSCRSSFRCFSSFSSSSSSSVRLSIVTPSEDSEADAVVEVPLLRILPTEQVKLSLDLLFTKANLFGSAVVPGSSSSSRHGSSSLLLKTTMVRNLPFPAREVGVVGDNNNLDPTGDNSCCWLLLPLLHRAAVAAASFFHLCCLAEVHKAAAFIN